MSAPPEQDPLTDSPLCTGDPLAKSLSVLEPMPTALNRDQLMFAAGAAGRDRDVGFWKRIVYGQMTAACLLVGLGVAMYGFQNDVAPTRGGNGDMAEKPKPAPPPAPRVKTPTLTPEPPAPSLEDDGDAARMAKYLRLRSDVLTLGLNVLPNPHAPAANVDVGQLEDSLRLPRGTFATHGLPKKAEPKPETESDP